MDRHPAGEGVRSAMDALVRRSKVPGIQYIVVAADQAVFEHASGWADIARRRPMLPATTMMAYSMSKTITAAAVLQLVEEGKFGLDDSIDRYLESNPYGSAVTVRQLLSHTSGIPNPIPLRWVHPVGRHEGFDERTALAAVLRRHSRLKSTPGSRYAYSNIGYWLLGRIIENACGEPFTARVTEHVLRPLGIESWEIAYSIPDTGAHAQGYLEKLSWMNVLKRFLVERELIGGYEGRWLLIGGHYLNGPAFGGLIGTAAGFGRFLQDQLRRCSVLFGDSVRALFYEPQRTTTGAVVAMTPGWHIGASDGQRFYYKEGGGGGFHCMMRRYPASGHGSVVMTNATGFDVAGFLDRTDRQFR